MLQGRCATSAALHCVIPVEIYFFIAKKKCNIDFSLNRNDQNHDFRFMIYGSYASYLSSVNTD